MGMSQSHLWDTAFTYGRSAGTKPTTSHGNAKGGKGGAHAQAPGYRVAARKPDDVSHISVTMGKAILRAHYRDPVNGPTPIGAPRTVEAQIAALRQQANRLNAKAEREQVEREARETLRAKALASKPVVFCGKCAAIVPDARPLARWKAHKPDCPMRPDEWRAALAENPALKTDVLVQRYVRDLHDEWAAKQLAAVATKQAPKPEVPALQGSASDPALEAARDMKPIVYYPSRED